MRVATKPLADYPLWLRPFFWLQRRNYGQVLLPGLCWGRSPRLFAAVATLYGALNRRSSPLSPVLRSLITVRVSQLNHCAFCVDLNAQTLIQRAGSEDKVAALAHWPDSPLFDDFERAALAYAEAMSRLGDGQGSTVTDAHVNALKAWLDEDGVVELTGLIAFQTMSAKFNAALDVPAQGFCLRPPHLPSLPTPDA
ncbi:MAG: carboxymuconolactone decarboxylase family protein [Aeromonas sp.]